MDVGMMMVFTNYGWENCSDQRVWDEEIRLARIAAEGQGEVRAAAQAAVTNPMAR